MTKRTVPQRTAKRQTRRKTATKPPTAAAAVVTIPLESAQAIREGMEAATKAILDGGDASILHSLRLIRQTERRMGDWISEVTP